MKRFTLTVAAMVLAVGSLLGADVDLTHAKCPVGGDHAIAAVAVDYKGAKVYFCCAGCDTTFNADPAKFAVEANHQLFVTGQATQTASPMSGKAVSADYSLEMAGAKVLFASAAERDGVANSDEDQQLQSVFNEDVFGKAFRVGQ